MTRRQAQVLIGLGAAVAALLVALVVVLVLRSGDDGTAAPTVTTSSLDTTTTTAATTTSTTAATTSSAATTTSATTTSTSSTTTTTAAVACPGAGAGPLPVGSTIAVDVWGNFDGEGSDDRFLVYSDSGGAYWARVELSYGYASVAPDPQPGPGVINAKAVDLGGGADLAIAESLASPSSRLATFYFLYGCQLDTATLSGGGVAEFPLRMSGMALAGITCRGDGITVTDAEVTGDMSGSDWAVGSVDYQWVPDLGEFQGSLGMAVLLHSPADDAAIQAAADWNC
jgi:hypothetical protein